MNEENEVDTEEENNDILFCDLSSIVSIKKECLVSPNANEYLCVQCGNILIPQFAYQHNCLALLCKGCLSSNKCHKCNELTSSESIHEIKDTEFLEKLGSLEISCPSNIKGAEGNCTWIGKLGEVISHATYECINTQMKCKFKCGAAMPRSKISVHFKECKNRKIKCKYCNKKVCNTLINYHIKNECESPNNLERHIKCPLSHLGCYYLSSRPEVMKHLEDFKTHLQLCIKKIKDLQNEKQTMLGKIQEISARQQLIEDNMPAIMRCPANHLLQKNPSAQQKCRICDANNDKTIWICIPCKYIICKHCHSIKKNTLPLCPLNSLHCMIPKDCTSKCSACQENDKKILFWCPHCSYYMCKGCSENNHLI